MGLLSSAVEQLVIKLDSTDKPFLAGDTVAGTIDVTTKKENVKVTKITVEVKGNTKVNFSHTTRAKKGKQGKSKSCKLDLDFFKELITVERETVLTAGTKTYQFEFNLPTNLRSSFNGKEGMYSLQNITKLISPLSNNRKVYIH